MTYHERLLNRAVEVARDSRHPKWQLGAVAVRGRNIVAYAPNKFRKTPWLDSGVKATVHAEEAVLRRLGLARSLLPGQMLSM